MNYEEILKLSTLTIYRMLIKNFQFYPSKNRFQIMLAIKEDFKENKNLTDKKKIFIEDKKARMGLAHLFLYKAKNKELQENYTNLSGG